MPLVDGDGDGDVVDDENVVVVVVVVGGVVVVVVVTTADDDDDDDDDDDAEPDRQQSSSSPRSQANLRGRRHSQQCPVPSARGWERRSGPIPLHMPVHSAGFSQCMCGEIPTNPCLRFLYKLCSGCHHSPSVCPHKFAPVLVETLRKSPEKQPTLLPCADLVVADLKRVGLLHVHLHIHVDRA